jgi:hypothetical protein
MRAANLIPAEQRSGAAVGAGHSEGGAYAVLAVVAGIAVLAVLYGMAHHQITSRSAQIASMTARSQQVQSDASRLAPYTSFIALREQRSQAVAQLVDSRFDWGHVIHEFGRVLPLNVSISALTGTIGSTTTSTVASSAPAPATGPAASTPGSSAPASSTPAATAAPVTSATPPGSVPTFTLAGCATSQPAVAQMLERLRLIDGVATVALQSSTKTSNSGSGGGCPATAPVFNVQITFEALPSTAAAAASAKAVSNTTGAGPAAAKPTTTGTTSK